jgi:Fur family iron response transcriptional regulator
MVADVFDEAAGAVPMRPEMITEMTDGCESCDLEEGEDGFDPIGRHMRAKLQMAALGATPQRLALCSLLFMASDRHVTAEMLSREASAMDLPLTPKSVKAGLQEFTRAGLVREVALYGATVWYDTNTGSHFHFYDEDAKLLFDMPDAMIPLFNLPAAEAFDVVGVDLIVRIRRIDGV